MFKFHKENKEKDADRERQIFEAKLKIKMLLKKENENLNKELAVARELKKAGKKSAENYSRIGIHYYMLQVLTKADERLADIESTDELNETLSALGGVLGSVNALGKGQTKAGTGAIFSGIDRLNRSREKEGGRMQGILQNLEGASSVSEKTESISNLAGLDMIERLINGTGTTQEHVDYQEDILSEIYEASAENGNSQEVEADIKNLIDNL